MVGKKSGWTGLDGKSVTSMGSRGRAAAEEVQQLISEVITS